MGIYDRDYIKQGSRPMGAPAGGPTERLRVPLRPRMLSANTWIILINIAVFVVGGFLRPYPDADTALMGNVFFHFGHFSTFEGFRQLEIWRLVTFQFLHANMMHLLLNMIGLWIFGSLVEQHLGAKRYVAFYLVCGIFGGLMYLILNLLGAAGLAFPGVLINDPKIPLVGASAGVFGVIMACAYIEPDSKIHLLIPPVTLTMRVVAYAYVGIAVLNLLVIRGQNQGGDAAHIGGALAGYFFIRNVHLLRDFFDVFNDSRTSGKRGKAARREDEIDRILKKVSRVGLHNLTPKERRFLSEQTRVEHE